MLLRFISKCAIISFMFFFLAKENPPPASAPSRESPSHSSSLMVKLGTPTAHQYPAPVLCP